MKSVIKYLFLIFLFVSCKGNKSESGQPDALFPNPRTIVASPEDGYLLNTVTGDTIEALVLESGDTLQTGIPISIQAKVINIDSVDLPNAVPLEEPQTKTNAHPNVYPVGNNLRKTRIDKDALIITKLPVISLKDTSHYIVNSTNDTIKTGVAQPIIGKTVPFVHPEPIEALLPRFKDATINDLKYLDVDQGMPSSYILSILEDRTGNFWFGTNGGGVAKYDGNSFEHFDEKEGLSNNRIRTIVEDNNGNIWFGTNGGGVNKYDGKDFTHFTEKEGLSNNNVLSILQDSKGFLWFATYGGGVCKYDGKSLTHYSEKEGLSNNYVKAIIEDRKGNLWFGTNRGASMFDGKSFTHFGKEEGLVGNNVWSIVEDKKERIWFGTNGGVSVYNGETITNYTKDNGLSDNTLRTILEDEEGNLWFGTFGGGINKFDGNSFTNFTEKEGLSNNAVWTSWEDSKGNLWFGTYGGGVSIYNKKSFRHFTENEGLSNNTVRSILEDNKGNLWFGTWGGGVSKYNGETFTHFNENEGLVSDIVLSILEDKEGNIWFGTSNQGVCKFDGTTFTSYTTKHGLSNNTIRVMLQDQKGDIWFGTNKGVTIYDGQNFRQITVKEGLSNNSIWSLIEDQQGNIWIGTLGGGVSKFDGKSITHFTEREGMSSNSIWTILEEKNGTLWFGTWGGGASKFDGETFTHFTEKEGLSNNIVLSIVQDENENLWFGTEYGLIYAVNDTELEDSLHVNTAFEHITLHKFEKNDGLKGVDFYSNSVCLDNDNRIWWGTGKSLTMLNLNVFSTSNKPPRVHLTQLDINGEFIDYRHISDSLSNEIRFSDVQAFENYPLDLELPYYKNHLTFHFTAIDWSAPHKTQYSYLMDGLSNNWSVPSRTSKVDYRNIPYGEYTFKVRSIGESGTWSEVFAYSFVIAPPWWHSWWARVVYAIFGILLFYAFGNWRTAKLKKRQKELEKEIGVATKEIREQKEEVEEAHKEIKDSMEYAKRIQKAILPSTRVVKESLSQSFILYKPKDIVAGDFYWIEHKDDKILFAAADCTGHGVPGAMVSVICNGALNRAVREFGLTDPGEILDKARELVISEFEKADEVVKDGMDIAICSIHNGKLKYAGANNPLWLFRNGKFIETKADKQPIGKFDHPKPYTTHSFDVQEGDSIYIFTDGYVDQFGGPQGKKFKIKAFRSLIMSLQDKTMEEQGIVIENVFENWKGSLDQIDDVCVVGVRI